MTRRFMIFAALAALLAAGPVTAMAQGMSDQSKAKPMMQKKMAKKGPMKATGKLDNIADKLNACEMKPQAERQSCLDAATKM